MEAGRVAKKIVDEGTAVLRVVQVGNAAAAQMHHANFGNKRGKGGGDGGVYRVASRLQNLLSGNGRLRIPGCNHSTHELCLLFALSLLGA